MNNPQVLENEYITEYDHAFLGKLKEIGIPAKVSETPGRIRQPLPQLDPHTEEVLIDILGYSWDEIEKIQAKGVILQISLERRKIGHFDGMMKARASIDLAVHALQAISLGISLNLL